MLRELIKDWEFSTDDELQLYKIQRYRRLTDYLVFLWRQSPVMFLARFPVEILSQLTGQLILIDLVMLHACGDSLLNSKLKKNPVSIRVLSTRCVSYYKKSILRRFKNTPDLVYNPPTFYNLYRFIPKTAKRVTITGRLGCKVPMSVERLSTDHIDHDVKFKRNPGELEVEVESGNAIETESLKYVTHLQNYKNYHKAMVNLRVIYVAPGSTNAPINGVVFEERRPKCYHISSNYHDSPGKMWHHAECVLCSEKYRVSAMQDGECPPLPPCSALSIGRENFSNVRMLISIAPPTVEVISIYGSIEQMNEFCGSGGLDIIPYHVREVELILTEIWKGLKFIGVGKIYPFLVSVSAVGYVMGTVIEIENLAGIDECYYKLFGGDEERKKILQQYPRLSMLY